MTTKELNSIAVNKIFYQVLNKDPKQEATVVHKQFFFERGYKIFGVREIAVMFKE